jgi:hypothetical protein
MQVNCQAQQIAGGFVGLHKAACYPIEWAQENDVTGSLPLRHR